MKSDYYLASETFARALVGDDQPEEACYKLAELGPRVTAVTVGAKGYIAGFTYGVVQGWDVEKSLDLGA